MLLNEFLKAPKGRLNGSKCPLHSSKSKLKRLLKCVVNAEWKVSKQTMQVVFQDQEETNIAKRLMPWNGFADWPSLWRKRSSGDVVTITPPPLNHPLLSQMILSCCF